MRTTPSVARPSYPPSMATHMEPLWRVTRLLLGTEGLVGFYEKGQLVHSWTSTRGVRQGMVLGPVLFFHRHHRHPPPTGSSFPTQLHGVPGRRYGGGTTGHAWAGMRGDIQGDACPGHRDERGQDGGPPYRRTSGHARGVHPAVLPACSVRE
ncbi:putative SLACS reverse transcriptase [Trypanosoma cruzi]|uniref:Putative SLACS reverse transcriptase n=1 Tax=Trypanosoma cruzi TaxID=5693 RepID=A0A2V2US82_TRYCR|nr:putative SLACS reverse transcriptase [Trypanosoma cruzi]